MATSSKATNPKTKAKTKAKAKPADAAPVGRPTKYEPRFCEEVIAAGRKGYSLTAFAGSLPVARSTINEWMSQNPEFSEAVKVHAAARTHFLETGLLGAESGPQVTSRIFALKNASPDEWRDKQLHEVTGKDGGPVETLNVTDLDRAKAMMRLLSNLNTAKAEG